MISATLKRFRELPQVTRTMVTLYWIYTSAEFIVGMFLGIFVFLETQSLEAVLIYNVVYFIAIALGFVGWGILMAEWQISMRYNYLRAFACYTLSFLVLLFLPNTLPYLLLFGGINGFALGMMWIGIHSYEMLYTKDENRDFYSSMVSLGAQTMVVLSPLVATICFFLAERVFHVETYQILFYVLPFIYLSATPFLFKLPDYVPPRMDWKAFKEMFTEKHTNKAQAYYFMQGLGWPMWVVIFPLIAIESLGTVINVGILETIIGVLSLVVVAYLSHQRHENNRLQLFLFASLGYMVAEGFLLFWEASAVFFILYSLMNVFLSPIFEVSQHVIDLHVVDKFSGKEGFYPGLLYRDAILALARLTGLLVVGAIIFLVPETALAVKGVIIAMILGNLALYGLAHRVVKH